MDSLYTIAIPLGAVEDTCTLLEEEIKLKVSSSDEEVL